MKYIMIRQVLVKKLNIRLKTQAYCYSSILNEEKNNISYDKLILHTSINNHL